MCSPVCGKVHIKEPLLLLGKSSLCGDSGFLIKKYVRVGYFPFQPVVHNWSIKGCGVCCPVCGKVHMKDPLLLIGKGSLIDGFSLKKYVTMTICMMSNADNMKINVL